MSARQLYSSPNGDRWFLISENGCVFVRHEANAGSGGHSTDIGLGDFLNGNPRHPQHEALARLIGSLAEGEACPDPRQH